MAVGEGIVVGVEVVVEVDIEVGVVAGAVVVVMLVGGEMCCHGRWGEAGGKDGEGEVWSHGRERQRDCLL